MNTYTSHQQLFPSIAMDAAGRFVVVWESSVDIPAGRDGSFSGILGQRYSADGTPMGGEFQINTFTTSEQRKPDIAMNADREFVVVWVGATQISRGVYAQRCDVTGAPQGTEIRVDANSAQMYGGSLPTVAMDAEGGFFVGWMYGVQFVSRLDMRRSDAAGVEQSGEIIVQDGLDGYVSRIGLSAMSDGGVVVSWSLVFGGVAARSYDASGAPRGGVIQVGAIGGERNAAMASDSTRAFTQTTVPT